MLLIILCKSYAKCCISTATIPLRRCCGFLIHIHLDAKAIAAFPSHSQSMPVLASMPPHFSKPYAPCCHNGMYANFFPFPMRNIHFPLRRTHASITAAAEPPLYPVLGVTVFPKRLLCTDTPCHKTPSRAPPPVYGTYRYLAQCRLRPGRPCPRSASLRQCQHEFGSASALCL